MRHKATRPRGGCAGGGDGGGGDGDFHRGGDSDGNDGKNGGESDGGGKWYSGKKWLFPLTLDAIGFEVVATKIRADVKMTTNTRQQRRRTQMQDQAVRRELFSPCMLPSS